MTPLTDRLRRVSTLVLVVAGLVLGPQLAFATFGASTAAPAMNVGTATMVAPTGVTGSYDCRIRGFFERDSVSVTVTRVSDRGPVGASYLYTLTQAGELRDTVKATGPDKAVTLSGEIPFRLSPRNIKWEVTVVATIGQWTSEPYVKPIVCDLGLGSGRL